MAFVFLLFNCSVLFYLKLRLQMEKEDFENEASLLSVDEMQEIVQNKA